MEKNILFPTSRLFSNLTRRDLFGFIFFLLIPLGFFAFDFIGKYRIIFYVVLVICVAIYTIVGQFLFEKGKFGGLGKQLLALVVINTLVISLVNFTGNVESPYFFVLYFLIFSVAIFSPVEVFVLECLIVFASILVLEFYKIGSFVPIFKDRELQELVNILSIPATLPLMFAISSFVKNLELKKQLLTLSRDLLAIEDIEDEALLEEIDQGIIILDPSLSIAKISRWVEHNFETTAKVLLGKKITDLELYDAVTNKRLLPSDQFYKNLTSSSPQPLRWRILYRNQYGKYKKFVIKQTPLIVGESVIGILLSVEYPPKSLKDVITSFNQLFSFRISSSVSMVKNLLSTSSEIQKDPVYPKIKLYIERITQLLNDVAIKNEIADGIREITLSNFDLQILIKNVISEIGESGNISVWNVSPLYKNMEIMLNTDASLCERLLDYSIKGAVFLSKDTKVSLSIDEDEIQKRLTISVTSDVSGDFPVRVDILEPFFAGKLIVLAKYKGSGLEFSNASLIASYLGFDYSAQIENNKLVVKIIF